MPKEPEEPVRDEPLIVLNNQGAIRLKLRVPSKQRSEENPSLPDAEEEDKREDRASASPEKQDSIKLKISLKSSPEKAPEPERIQLKLRGFASSTQSSRDKEEQEAEPIKMCIRTRAPSHSSKEPEKPRLSEGEVDRPPRLRLTLPKPATISESKPKTVRLVVPRAQAVVKDTPQVHRLERCGLAKLKIRVGSSDTPTVAEGVAKLRIRVGDVAPSPTVTNTDAAAIPKLVIRRNGMQHVASVRGRPYMRKVKCEVKEIKLITSSSV